MVEVVLQAVGEALVDAVRVVAPRAGDGAAVRVGVGRVPVQHHRERDGDGFEVRGL